MKWPTMAKVGRLINGIGLSIVLGECQLMRCHCIKELRRAQLEALGYGLSNPEVMFLPVHAYHMLRLCYLDQ